MRAHTQTKKSPNFARSRGLTAVQQRTHLSTCERTDSHPWTGLSGATATAIASGSDSSKKTYFEGFSSCTALQIDGAAHNPDQSRSLTVQRRKHKVRATPAVGFPPHMRESSCPPPTMPAEIRICSLPTAAFSCRFSLTCARQHKRNAHTRKQAACALEGEEE
jgi:hypothetical protein